MTDDEHTVVDLTDEALYDDEAVEAYRKARVDGDIGESVEELREFMEQWQQSRA